MKDFFISYTSADRQWAEWIAWHLEEADYSVIIQVWDFRPGGDFVQEMDQATKNADRIIAVLSEKYFESRFTQAEWGVAFAKGNLLPVRIANFNIEGLLSIRISIDLDGREELAAIEMLLAGIKSERAKPSTRPPYPGSKPEARSISEKPQYPGPIVYLPDPQPKPEAQAIDERPAYSGTFKPPSNSLLDLFRRQKWWIVCLLVFLIILGVSIYKYPKSVIPTVSCYSYEYDALNINNPARKNPEGWDISTDSNGDTSLNIHSKSVELISPPENGKQFCDFKATFRIRVKKGQTSASWMLRAKDEKSYYLFMLQFANNQSPATLEGFIYNADALPRPLLRGDDATTSLSYGEPFPEDSTLTIEVNATAFRFEHTITLFMEIKTPEDAFKKAAHIKALNDINRKTFSDPEAKFRTGAIGFRADSPEGEMIVRKIRIQPK